MFNLGSRTHRRAVRAVTASPALLERPDAAAVPGLALAVPGAAGVVVTLALAHGNQACKKERPGGERKPIMATKRPNERSENSDFDPLRLQDLSC